MKKTLFTIIIIIIFITGCKRNLSNEIQSIHETTNNSETEEFEFNPNPTEVLTLDKVRELALKGEELSWKDFNNYYGTNVGMGISIIIYNLGDGYVLTLYITNYDDNPKSFDIILSNEERTDDIDIRYNDVEAYLKLKSN